MNTNTDQPFFPDEKLLQELANRLFKENESYSPIAGHWSLCAG